MALKDLTTPTMLSLFDAWLDSKRELPKLKSLTRSSALLPDLESARQGLQNSHAVSTKAAPELQKLQALTAELDGSHDRKARGLDKVLDGLSELTDDAELAASLAALRTEILGPKGLLVISSSYTDEAQNAKLVDKRLSEESRAILKDVSLHDKTLGEWLKIWQGTAKELGKAEAERTAFETRATTGAQPADAVRARNKAIRTINALTTMLDLDDPDSTTRAAILGPLDIALSKAEKRTKKAVVPPTPAPAPQVGPAADDAQ